MLGFIKYFSLLFTTSLSIPNLKNTNTEKSKKSQIYFIKIKNIKILMKIVKIKNEISFQKRNYCAYRPIIF